jgi:hypothetical protein
MFPTSHVRSATIEVLATTALPKVEDILSKQTMPISDRSGTDPPATCAQGLPPASSVYANIAEKHTGSATMFKMFKPTKMPSSTLMPMSLPIAPTVTAIVVDGVTIVNEQIASIIGNNAESVVATPEESCARRPPYCKMIASVETWPSATSIPIVHIMSPSSHIRSPPIQILTVTALTKVEDILHP